jgi:peptidyl-prolyl cis-trans isomerase B (cyclophilin B)
LGNAGIRLIDPLSWLPTVMKTRLLALAAVFSASIPLLRATDIEMKIDLAGAERTVVIRLDEAIAPKTSANFAKLCRENFYRGVAMHRVIPNYIVQTGDPLSKEPVKRAEWGTGGPGYTIPAELGGKHVIGAVAAARLGDKANPERASSGSQFYVVLRDIPQLDGQYTVFGTVVSGLETFIEIASAPTDDAKVPTVPISFISSRVLGEESAAPVEKAPEMKPVPPPVPLAAANKVDSPKEPTPSSATAAVTDDKPAAAPMKPVATVTKTEPEPAVSKPASAISTAGFDTPKPMAPAAAAVKVDEPVAAPMKPAPVMSATGFDAARPKEPTAATATAAVTGDKPAAVTPQVTPEETVVAKPAAAPAILKPIPLAIAEPDPLEAKPEPEEEKPLVPMTKLTLNDTTPAPLAAGLPPVLAETPPQPSQAKPAVISSEPDPLGAAAKTDPASGPIVAETKKEPTISDLATDTMRVNGDRGLSPVRLEPNQNALARATESIAPQGGSKKAADSDDGFVPLSSVGNLGGLSFPPAPASMSSAPAPAPVESVSGSGFSFASSEGTAFKPKSVEPQPTPEPESAPIPAPAAVSPKPKAKPKAPKPESEPAPPSPVAVAPDTSGFQPLALEGEPAAPQQSPPAPAPAAQERPKGFIGRFIRRVW